ncbi:mCG146082, partial [Mus musculus]
VYEGIHLSAFLIIIRWVLCPYTIRIIFPRVKGLLKDWYLPSYFWDSHLHIPGIPLAREEPAEPHRDTRGQQSL